MNDPYNTGHGQGYGCATGDRSLSINMNDFDHINAFQQQQTFARQDSFLPRTRPRHDSVNSQASPHALRLPGGQHQAENQPRGQQSTPHISNAYPCQSMVMSRNTSHTSHQSSTSSGQQYGGGRHFVPHHSFPNIYSPIGADMQRSRSAYSTTSTFHDHQMSPQPSMSQRYQLPVNRYSPNPSDELTTNFSVTTQYDLSNSPLDNANIDYHLTGLNGMAYVGDDVFGINSSE